MEVWTWDHRWPRGWLAACQPGDHGGDGDGHDHDGGDVDGKGAAPLGKLWLDLDLGPIY